MIVMTALISPSKSLVCHYGLSVTKIAVGHLKVLCLFSLARNLKHRWLIKSSGTRSCCRTALLINRNNLVFGSNSGSLISKFRVFFWKNFVCVMPTKTYFFQSETCADLIAFQKLLIIVKTRTFSYQNQSTDSFIYNKKLQ